MRTIYFDSLIGLIPVKPVACYPRPFNVIAYDLKVTRTTGPYKAGEIITTSGNRNIVRPVGREINQTCASVPAKELQSIIEAWIYVAERF